MGKKRGGPSATKAHNDDHPSSTSAERTKGAKKGEGKRSCSSSTSSSSSSSSSLSVVFRFLWWWWAGDVGCGVGEYKTPVMVVLSGCAATVSGTALVPRVWSALPFPSFGLDLRLAPPPTSSSPKEVVGVLLLADEGRHVGLLCPTVPQAESSRAAYGEGSRVEVVVFFGFFSSSSSSSGSFATDTWRWWVVFGVTWVSEDDADDAFDDRVEKCEKGGGGGGEGCFMWVDVPFCPRTASFVRS